MSADVALTVLTALAVATFCLVLNIKARETWLKALSLFAMLGFVALAGYPVVQTILLGGGSR